MAWIAGRAGRHGFKAVHLYVDEELVKPLLGIVKLVVKDEEIILYRRL